MRSCYTWAPIKQIFEGLPHTDDDPGESHVRFPVIFNVNLFLDTQVSLAPTHVSKLVGPSVGHTFGFPISGQ